MQTTDFNYHLPPSLIATTPPPDRGDARLLVLDRQTGQYSDQRYVDFTTYLKAGDVLVLNDTRVIKARLIARAKSGKTHELLLTERHATEDHLTHRALYRGHLKPGMVLQVEPANSSLQVRPASLAIVSFEPDGIAVIRSDRDLYELAELAGSVPLPPYLKRQATPDDTLRYQTVFAKQAGSVAAPTASLNLTPDLLKQIENAGVIICYLTLHVGLGTFLPIRSHNLDDHKMHSEYFEIPKSTVAAIRKARSKNHNITAIGTTVARTLEYAADSIKSDSSDKLSGEADIFIYPGYKFQIVDQLLTNFHAPGSTVLMLAAAFGGWDNLKNAYDHAIAEKYRFLSYGDSMFIR